MDREGPAMRQLGVRHLQLGPLAGDNRPVLASVKLERLAGCKSQRHERPTATGLLLALPLGLPAADKRTNPRVGTMIAQRHQIGVQLP